MLSALEEKNNYKGEFLTGKSMWIMGVSKVLIGQVTGKHFQMKVLYEHDKHSSAGNMSKDKSLFHSNQC